MIPTMSIPPYLPPFYYDSSMDFNEATRANGWTCQEEK